MTSLPVPSLDSSSIQLLSPMRNEVFSGGDDRQGRFMLLLTIPARDESTSPAERAPFSAPFSFSRSHNAAEDLTKRCSYSELHTNEHTTLDDRADVAASTGNPVFGQSKSPKSYWLRRHSDSVFARANSVHLPRDDDASTQQSSRHSKERVVSDSRFTAESTPDDHQTLDCRFEATLDGMEHWESDEVFDEAPVVHSTHPGDGVRVQPSEEPTTTFQKQLHGCRGRLTVASTRDLVDMVGAEHQSPGRGEGLTVSSTTEKLEMSDVSEPSLNNVTISTELLLHMPENANHDDDDDENRKSLNEDGEMPRPETVSARAAIHRRLSRVVRSSQPESISGCDAATSGDGGKVHRCTVCRRTFSRSDMLERHARLHTGVRPYACRLCTQVFSRSDHLTTHLRTHTGEKPYACPRCAYTASRRDMVTRHLRVHQSTDAVDPSAVTGPPRRRIYHSRYKERPLSTAQAQLRDVSVAASSSPERQPDEATTCVRPGRRLGSSSTPRSVTRRRDVCPPSVSPPATESVSAYRRRLEHIQTLHALSRSVAARGSTGSTDSYYSPGCLSGASGDVFEFAVGGGTGGLDGSSPDVFRSPTSARQSTVFLFPYTAASSCLSVCDPADSF